MRIHKEIPSRLELILEFLTEIIEEIKKLNIAEPELFKIKLALNEALVNAAKHGNKLNAELSVHVDLDATDQRVIFKIRDEGAGFDISKLADPTKEENLGKTDGRGIFLVRSLMDQAEFSDCGRQLKMVKFLGKGEVAR